jgi:hypothetical protein
VCFWLYDTMSEVVSSGDDVGSIASQKPDLSVMRAGPRRTAAERAALQLPPRRAAKTVKIAPISRAEGGQLQAPVGPQGRTVVGLFAHRNVKIPRVLSCAKTGTFRPQTEQLESLIPLVV